MTDGKSVRRLTSILSKPNPQRFIWFSWGWTVPQNQSIIKGLTGFYWVSLGFHWVLGLWQMLSVEDPGGGGCSMKEANGGFLLAIAAGPPPPPASHSPHQNASALYCRRASQPFIFVSAVWSDIFVVFLPLWRFGVAEPKCWRAWKKP